MAHEVRAESVELLVARMTNTDRNPYADARLILRSLRVPQPRIEKFIQFMEAHALECAYREIARRYPEPTPIRLSPCLDCDGSGVASYGYCKRCDATGRVPAEVA